MWLTIHISGNFNNNCKFWVNYDKVIDRKSLDGFFLQLLFILISLWLFSYLQLVINKVRNILIPIYFWFSLFYICHQHKMLILICRVKKLTFFLSFFHTFIWKILQKPFVTPILIISKNLILYTHPLRLQYVGQEEFVVLRTTPYFLYVYIISFTS